MDTALIDYRLDQSMHHGPQVSTKALAILVDDAEQALISWLQLHAPVEISRLASNIDLLKNSPLIGTDIRPVVIELINQLAEMDRLS